MGRKVTGSTKALIITTSNRNLLVKCYRKYPFLDLLYSLALAKEKSDYTKINRHLSFAPKRPPKSKCEFFIDGVNYF